MKIFPIAFLLISFSQLLFAQQDTLKLRNGEMIVGSIFAENKYITKIKVDTGWVFIQNTEIIPPENKSDIDQFELNRNAQLNRRPSSIQIPAGEFLVVSTQRKINTKYAKPGEIVECKLVQSLIDQNDRVIIPQHTTLIARITESRSGNAFRKASLNLELIEMQLNDQNITISTNQQIRIINNYTAERILGSASTGSLIGGIFFNEWLEGALVGAALGAVTSLIIENKNIVIPENSTLEFMLDSPFTINLP